MVWRLALCVAAVWASGHTAEWREDAARETSKRPDSCDRRARRLAADCGELAACYEDCEALCAGGCPEGSEAREDRHACRSTCDVRAEFADPEAEGRACCGELDWWRQWFTDCEEWFTDSYGFACDEFAWQPAEGYSNGKWRLSKKGAALCGCGQMHPDLTYDECREARDSFVKTVSDSGACAHDPGKCSDNGRDCCAPGDSRNEPASCDGGYVPSRAGTETNCEYECLDPSCMIPDLGAPESNDGTPGCYLQTGGLHDPAKCWEGSGPDTDCCGEAKATGCLDGYVQTMGTDKCCCTASFYYTCTPPPKFVFNSQRQGGAKPLDVVLCRGDVDPTPAPTPSPTPEPTGYPTPLPTPAPTTPLCDESVPCCGRGSQVDGACVCEGGWSAADDCASCDLDLVCSGRGTCDWDFQQRELTCSCPRGWFTLPADAEFGRCNWFKPGDFCDSADPPCLPGLDMAGLGYDIVAGTFVARAVALTFDQGNTASIGGRSYLSALEVRATERRDLSLEERSSSLTDTEEYFAERMRSLGVSASYDAGLIGASIDAEAVDTSSVLTSLEKQEVVTEQRSELAVFEVQLVTDTMDAEFQQELDALPELYSGRTYQRFINRFGTHYVKSVLLGGYFTKETRMSGCAYSQIDSSVFETAVEAEVAKQYGFGEVGGSVRGGTLDAVEEAQYLMSQYAELSFHVVGGGLEERTGFLCDNDMASWYESVVREPDVISFKLGELADLAAGHAHEEDVARAVREYYARVARSGEDRVVVDTQPPELNDQCQPLQRRPVPTDAPSGAVAALLVTLAL